MHRGTILLSIHLKHHIYQSSILRNQQLNINFYFSNKFIDKNSYEVYFHLFNHNFILDIILYGNKDVNQHLNYNRTTNQNPLDLRTSYNC